MKTTAPTETILNNVDDIKFAKTENRKNTINDQFMVIPLM